MAAALCCLGRPAVLSDGGGVPPGTKANEVIVCITGGHHLHGQVLLLYPQLRVYISSAHMRHLRPDHFVTSLSLRAMNATALMLETPK